ncbi:MAG: formate dehydrogenase accessory protein FdhE [Coriobacteriales bacterium]|nr:formate dehydrogenase accessory protein FdhE [Coriobacteriales bacterium]MBQ6585450.1 formate dehydrogenase accessory protein FdhE [Coriobacteriales bacterium]
MDLALIDRVAAAYDGKLSPQDRSCLNLCRALWGVMSRAGAQASTLMQRDAAQAPALDELMADLEEGLPFMSNHPISVDATALADVVELLLSVVSDSGAYDKSVCQAMRALNLRQLIMLSDLDLASVDPEQYLNSIVAVMQNYGIDGSQITILVGLLSMGLRALQEPAAAAMVAALPQDALDEHRHDHCPVCGGRPALAILTRNKEGQGSGRKLACLQCGSIWDFDRIRCPHCGNKQVDKLGYRTVKGYPDHRIDYCDVCGNYIRTAVVETRNSPYSIDVEDCVMASLDAYADESQREEDRSTTA